MVGIIIRIPPVTAGSNDRMRRAFPPGCVPPVPRLGRPL